MTRRRVIATVTAAVVVVAAFVGFLPRVADLGESLRLLDTLGPGAGMAIATLTVANLLTYPLLSMASLPGLRFGTAFAVSQASTAISNTVPAGAGLGVGVTYAMYSRSGFAPGPIAVSIGATGVANTLVKFAMPAVAAIWLATAGDAPGWAWRAAQIGIALTVLTVTAGYVLATRPHVADSAARATARAWARLRRRPPNEASATERVATIRRDATWLLGGRGRLVLAIAVLSHIALYALFAACLTALDVGMRNDVSFAVFAAVRFGLVVPVTPGGVGVAEAGYAAALVGAGAAAAPAVAAVLIFRAASYVLPIPVGLACWLAWRSTTRSGRGSGDRRTGRSPGGRSAQPR